MRFLSTVLLPIILLLSDFALAQQPQWRLANGTQGLGIKDIDIYPKDPDTLYAISTYEFLISTDRGENWQIIPNVIEGGASAALRVDPFDPRRIYASHYYTFQGGNGVSMSTDGGFNWQLLFWGFWIQAAVVQIDPSNHWIIYAGQGPDDIRKSTDHGQTWDLLPTDSTMGGGFWDLAITTTNPQVLYAAYFTGIFKSSDGGYNWEKLPLGILLNWPSVAVDPRNENVVYVTSFTYGGDSAGVFKSTDGGETWNAMNKGLTQYDRDIYTIEINPKYPDEVYIGASGQNDLLFKSTNGGKNWVKFSDGLPNEGFTTSIAIDTLNRRLYAGVVSPGNLDGVYIYDEKTVIQGAHPQISESFSLHQNYPNPFNSVTIIPYTLPEGEYVTLKVYDVAGRQISTLLHGYQTTGRHNIMWNAEGLPSGIYFYKIRVGNLSDVRPMLLIR